jgi:hypothetical protein
VGRKFLNYFDALGKTLTEEEKVPRLHKFLDRLKPNMSFLIRLVGLSKGKDLDLVKSQAEELETMLSAEKGQLPEAFPAAIRAFQGNQQPVHNPPNNQVPPHPVHFTQINQPPSGGLGANFVPLGNGNQKNRFNPRGQQNNNPPDQFRNKQQRAWNNVRIATSAKRWDIWHIPAARGWLNSDIPKFRPTTMESAAKCTRK